jgi:HEAT repeat protein
MRTFPFMLVLAALLFGATLVGRAQKTPDQKEIEKKRAQEKFNGKALFDWSEDLKSKDLSVQLEALVALKFYGSAAQREMPFILKAINHKDASMKVNAIITLGFVGVPPQDAENAVKQLSSLMYDPQYIVRFQAIRTLTQFGQFGIEETYKATPALIKALQDIHTWEIRSAAANALGYVAYTNRGFDKQAFAALLGTAERDPWSSVRLSAVLSLILFGKPSSSFDQKEEERVLHTLTVERPGKPFSIKVAIWAYVGLMRIDKVSEGHLASISKYLKNKDLQARTHAARALAVVGPQASSQVPDLIVALDKEEDASAIIWMVSALGNMRDAAKEAQPHLERLKNHKEPLVREAVIKALSDIQEKMRLDDKPVPKKKN